MKNTLKLIGATFAVAIAMVATPAHAAQTIGVQPIKSEIAMDPGETKTIMIDVINRSGADANAIGSIESFSANDENGYPAQNEKDSDDPQNILNWITLPEGEILVPANDRTEVEITITAPEDAMPGGRYAALFYQPVVPEHEKATGVKIITRVASLIIVRINGDVIEEGNVEKFELDQQNLVTDRDIKFGVQFKNEGTVHVKPEGKIIIRDKDGNVMQGVGKVNAEGKETVVDYIPVNDGSGNVLPNSTRTFLCQWLNPYFSEGMTATLQLSYGVNNPQTIEKTLDINVNANAEVSGLRFNKEKRLFSFNLQNTGDFRILPQFNLNIFNDFEFQVDSIEYNDETYIEPGESREIKFTWDKNGIPNGKYIARVKFASSILADLNIETSFRVGDDFLGSILDSGATPYVVFLLVLAGVGAYIYRKKSEKGKPANQ